MHELGYLHKDIKLNNLMIKNKVPYTRDQLFNKINDPDRLNREKNIENSVIKLIDFSIVEPYKDKVTGAHIKEEVV